MPNYRYVGAAAVFVEVGGKTLPVGVGDYVTMSSEEFQTATQNGLRFVEAKPEQVQAKAATESEGGEKP
jgi:hypothetical protein